MRLTDEERGQLCNLDWKGRKRRMRKFQFWLTTNCGKQPQPDCIMLATTRLVHYWYKSEWKHRLIMEQ